MKKVVFIDAGTGRGGASRSLYYLVSRLDRTVVCPVVILLNGNPMKDWFDRDGIEAEIVPEIVRFRPGERKNWLAFLLFLVSLPKFFALRKTVQRHLGETGIVHANHENLAITAWLLSVTLRCPWVCHIRTTLVPTFSGRLVYGLIRRSANHIVFITQRNLEHFADMAGAPEKSRVSVVHNSYVEEVQNYPPLEVPLDPDHRRFRVLTLSSITPNRGIDRQIEVARILKARGCDDILFVICGGEQHRSLSPVGGKRSYHDEVVASVDEYGLHDIVYFAGHTHPPERALKACDILIKLGRENVPWGRDLIEAMSHGLPIVTLGTFQGFVENGVNGFIDPDFDANRVADHIMRLRDDPSLLSAMRESNLEKAEQMFSPQVGALAMQEIYAGLSS